MNGVNDAYTILGMPRGAPRDAVRKRFFALCRLYHPDKNAAQGELATQKFIKAHDAYSVLMANLPRMAPTECSPPRPQDYKSDASWNSNSQQKKTSPSSYGWEEGEDQWLPKSMNSECATRGCAHYQNGNPWVSGGKCCNKCGTEGQHGPMCTAWQHLADILGTQYLRRPWVEERDNGKYNCRLCEKNNVKVGHFQSYQHIQREHVKAKDLFEFAQQKQQQQQQQQPDAESTPSTKSTSGASSTAAAPRARPPPPPKNAFPSCPPGPPPSDSGAPKKPRLFKAPPAMKAPVRRSPLPSQGPSTQPSAPKCPNSDEQRPSKTPPPMASAHECSSGAKPHSSPSLHSPVLESTSSLKAQRSPSSDAPHLPVFESSSSPKAQHSPSSDAPHSPVLGSTSSPKAQRSPSSDAPHSPVFESTSSPKAQRSPSSDAPHSPVLESTSSPKAQRSPSSDAPHSPVLESTSSPKAQRSPSSDTPHASASPPVAQNSPPPRKKSLSSNKLRPLLPPKTSVPLTPSRTSVQMSPISDKPGQSASPSATQNSPPLTKDGLSSNKLRPLLPPKVCAPPTFEDKNNPDVITGPWEIPCPVSENKIDVPLKVQHEELPTAASSRAVQPETHANPDRSENAPPRAPGVDSHNMADPTASSAAEWTDSESSLHRSHWEERGNFPWRGDGNWQSQRHDEDQWGHCGNNYWGQRTNDWWKPRSNCQWGQCGNNDWWGQRTNDWWDQRTNGWWEPRGNSLWGRHDNWGAEPEVKAQGDAGRWSTTSSRASFDWHAKVGSPCAGRERTKAKVDTTGIHVDGWVKNPGGCGWATRGQEKWTNWSGSSEAW